MVGRNDPCPCGSGKKYKKCCLAKDQAAAGRGDLPAAKTRRLAAPASPAPSPAAEPAAPPPRPRPAPAPPVDVSIPVDPSSPVPTRPMVASTQGDDADDHLAPPPQTPEQRLAAYRKADHESRLVLFEQTLADGLMTAKPASEMLHMIRAESLRRNRRERFDGLVDSLRRRQPDAYAAGAPVYRRWRLADALTTGRLDVVAALAREIAPRAAEDIDHFNATVDQLAWHDQLATLVKTMRVAWRGVRESAEITPAEKSSFARRAGALELYEYLEHTASPDPADAELTGRLTYVEVDRKQLARSLDCLTGKAGRTWTMDDFRTETEGPALQNLHDLGTEFQGWAHRGEYAPYTRAEMASAHIVRHVLDRRAGTPASEEHGRAGHPLCPDGRTLERLAGKLDFMAPHYYAAAAVAEMIPAWLRFLESRGLIEAEQGAEVLRDLRAPSIRVRDALRRDADDPAPAAAVASAWPAA